MYKLDIVQVVAFEQILMEGIDKLIKEIEE